MPVSLVERYDPQWPTWFDQLKARLETRVENHVRAIEYVGSTSVPDLLEGLPAHHVYVCPETSAELERHLAFRDFLRRSPEFVRQLSDLRWRLAIEHDNDRQAYMDGKEAFCRDILERALEG